jgi:uncharacterized protein (DUF924 family)
MSAVSPGEVLDFWFAPDVKAHWFDSSPDLDAKIRARFSQPCDDARNGALDGWAETPDGALALLILLDQFPRNLHRGSGQAFASDAKAREISARAREHGFDLKVEQDRRTFFYLPLMHSETVDDQRECMRLYEQHGDERSLDFARQHHDIIARFGRFPHRNHALGRKSTEDERIFLETHKGF